MSAKTYSLPQIWGHDAKALNEAVECGVLDPVPVSGDAWLRARARARAAGMEWDKPTAVKLLPAHDVADVPRFGLGEQRDRDEYRAHMSSHVATVLAGGDLSTLEPTC